MGKLQLTGQNLGRFYNSRSGRVYAMHSLYFEMKRSNLKLKTWPKHLLSSFLLDIVLHGEACKAENPVSF